MKGSIKKRKIEKFKKNWFVSDKFKLHKTDDISEEEQIEMLKYIINKINSYNIVPQNNKINLNDFMHKDEWYRYRNGSNYIADENKIFLRYNTLWTDIPRFKEHYVTLNDGNPPYSLSYILIPLEYLRIVRILKDGLIIENIFENNK